MFPKFLRPKKDFNRNRKSAKRRSHTGQNPTDTGTSSWFLQYKKILFEETDHRVFRSTYTWKCGWITNIQKIRGRNLNREP